MHSLMQVPVKSAVFGRLYFAQRTVAKRTARGTLIVNTLYMETLSLKKKQILVHQAKETIIDQFPKKCRLQDTIHIVHRDARFSV